MEKIGNHVPTQRIGAILFDTLYNTYSFFALYANVDGFAYQEAEVPVNERPEIDRWILSVLNSLVKNVDACYNDYEPTKAGRLITDFVNDNLSTGTCA